MQTSPKNDMICSIIYHVYGDLSLWFMLENYMNLGMQNC